MGPRLLARPHAAAHLVRALVGQWLLPRPASGGLHVRRLARQHDRGEQEGLPEQRHTLRACCQATVSHGADGAVVALHPLQKYYLRFWSVFGLVLAAPFYYAINHTDETRMPMVRRRGGGRATAGTATALHPLH